MQIPPKFLASSIESKWYAYWQEHDFFHSIPDDRKPYSIVIPPPNVTGVLHMGHMLNNTLQDILIRRARMKGYNACWVPGTDHASIATEAKVVAKLKEDGIEKSSLSRAAFLEHAWAWTHEYGGVILEQLKKLGCSCDWQRTKFTLDPELSESVIQVFVDLYEKGLIYKGYRMVNWDPQAQTTLSDEEVIYEEKQGLLYYIAYPLEDSEDTVTIATTRPETILGDTAICIHPDDQRYQHLHGKRARVPIANRSIPIITDAYVAMEFGTGCLKVTPAHDMNDKILGEKHNLEFIDIFHPDGTLNTHGLAYAGMDRFEVRKRIAKDLKTAGHLIKTEPHTNKVGTSERTKSVIEPRISEQWFLKMETLAKPAIDAVLKDAEIHLLPEKFKNTYRHWMENIRDWNISRQLWWGHRIPAYYYGSGSDDFVVAVNAETALQKAIEKSGKPSLTPNDLIQDSDVLDTWFSSWLWPISVFDGIRKPDNPDISYYYPTQVLVTGPDILFFWVARMIMSGYEFKNNKPFSHVYLTGLVRDGQGRKMSKQLGNSPDALALIENYGADAVRVGLMLSSAAGNDLLFDEKLCQQGKNFSNKIWNAYRLIEGWEVSETMEASETSTEALQWYENQFQKTLEQVEVHFSKYRISDALMAIYKLIWDDFCSWFLELIKPDYGQPIAETVLTNVRRLFEDNLRLLHPFMPFLSEELWHFIAKRTPQQALIVSKWPEITSYDATLLTDFEIAQEVVAGVRNFRKEKQLGFKEPLTLHIGNNNKPLAFEHCMKKLAWLDTIVWQTQDENKPGGRFRVQKMECFIPLQGQLDTELEREKLHDELKYVKGFLVSVEKKLSNERFINNAPEKVITLERKKAADAQEKITLLEKSLAQLKP